MVWHGTAQQKLCSYKTEEALQDEPRSNSNFYGSAPRGTTYKMGLRNFALMYLSNVPGCTLSNENEKPKTDKNMLPFQMNILQV